MEIILAADVIGIYCLMYRYGCDRLIDHLAGILSAAKGGLVKLDDPILMAGQFLDAAGSDFELRSVTGLAPDDLAAIVDRGFPQGYFEIRAQVTCTWFYRCSRRAANHPYGMFSAGSGL